MERSSKYREWLDAEHAGQDALAEFAFARLIAELPPVEASAAFVDAVVARAARGRARRQTVRRLARLAAAVLISFASIGAMYVLGSLAVSGIARGSVLLSDGLLWLLTSAGEGVRWWSLAARIGSAIGDSLMTPRAATAIVLIELLAASAIYALYRVLQDGQRTHDSTQVSI